MSDSEERDESDRSEYEEDELFETDDHRQRLTAAQKWIKGVIEKRERTQDAGGTKNAGGTKKASVRMTEEEVDQFFHLFPDLTDDKNDNTPTVLSAVVDLVFSSVEASIDSTAVKALVQRLAKQCTQFLCIRNDEQQNPLYLAIAKKKKYLVDYMVTSWSKDDIGRRYLAEALEDCRGNEKRKNCLHLAFEKDFKPTTLRKIVEIASTKTLEAVDTTGRRPMHYAVHYKCFNCDVIRAFIKRDQEMVDDHKEHSPRQPLDTFLDVNGETKASVYQEHVSSAAAHIDEPGSNQGIPDHHTKRGGLSTIDDGRGQYARGHGEEATQGHNLSIKSKFEPKLEPKSEKRTARPEPGIESRELHERTGRPKVRDHDKMVDNEDALTSLERQRQQLKLEEAMARREEIERNSGGREASKDRRSIGPPGIRDTLRIQTALAAPSFAKSSSDVAANTPKPLRRVPTMRGDIAAGKSESMAKRTTTVTKKPPKPVDHEAVARDSKKVLRMLKLHYMRTRNVERATSWLYQTNAQDIQTFYVHPKHPSELKKGIFKKAFENTKFDDILQFVHFPNVKVIQTRTPGSKDQSPNDGIGRWDMKVFFDFLHERGVRYILKVVVEEGGQSVHSDEAIKSSLDRITVEHLDWRKVDLDPEIICGIGSQAEDVVDRGDTGTISKSQLRKLDLQWSGNSAVLRAWSEPEGLPSLPHLNKVKIIVPSDVLLYDSSRWIEKKGREFEERLNRNSVARQQTDKSDSATLTKREIKVEFLGLRTHAAPDAKAATGLLQSGLTQGRVTGLSLEKSINTHEWLKCTDAFAKGIKPLWASTRKAYLNSIGVISPSSDLQTMHRHGKLPYPEDEVVVALIDDGVSLLDQHFVGRVLEGKTFDYREGVIGQSYHSARGHGTEMARNILRICPMAKIYPIRLKTQISADDTTSEINLKSAAEAIHAALEKKATIISMSWTIPIPKEPHPAQKLFEDAIREACKQNVLMFCSSPDGGGFKNVVDYPSAVQRDKIFRIGAAHDHGSAFEHTDKDVDFIFPGVQVNTNATTPATGSSIATALAAGLAATIIYCFKISAMAAKTQTRTMSQADISRLLPREDNLKSISRHAGMKAAFGSIGTVNAAGFIQIWEVLNSVLDKFENDDVDDSIKVQAIVDLCTKLRYW